MQMGRLDEAARLWERVLAAAPDHPQALFHLGQHAAYRNEPHKALDLLQRAAKAAPREPGILLHASFVYRSLGDTAAELATLDRAISIDPFFLPALLAKGASLDRTGQKRQAARVFRDALAIAPPDENLPPEIRATVARARQVIQENAGALEAYLDSALRDLPRPEKSIRFEEAKAALIGTRKVYQQQPTMLHYPRLPAIPFYERADFPWIGKVEAATDTIRTELENLLEQQKAEFRPYLANPQGNQIEYAAQWNAYFFWSDGKRLDDHCARCPKTAALLESLPLADVPGAAPTAFFSALEPKAGIPAHTGVTNTRLIVHLPLIVPGECWFRVGNETREWRLGEALIFDDTMEHEAWNGSDKLRVLLIFDIWNPYLDQAERQLVRTLMSAYQDYHKV